MKALRQAGLSTKTRSTRRRNRVARMSANREIEDYLGPIEEQTESPRNIPIRGRSDFFPSIVAETNLDPMELPLRFDDKARATRQTGTDNPDSIDDGAVLKFPRPSGTFQSMLATRRAKRLRKKAFRIHGFLTGCAMGSAAALVALFVLSSLMG